jgi:hypothetical protein
VPADDALVVLLAPLATRALFDPVVEDIVTGLFGRRRVTNPALDLFDLDLPAA